MKKWIGLTALMLLVGLLFVAPALSEETVREPAEWTVMFYFCGSDLESRHSLATENLKDITEVIYPANYIARYSDGGDAEPDADMASMPGIVNVLVETGGSEEWHARDIGMDIDPSALQRWRYNMYGVDKRLRSTVENGFELMQTLPLQNMADPGTLADFIRWGVETCPAKKYALVLWDHGDGARSGLIIDELFDRDILYLYELKQALADGERALRPSSSTPA